MDKVVPIWIAPNALTLLGLLCVISCTLLCLIMDIETGATPGWVFFLQGIFVFMYQTFDNLDGKQARKTGSSSALGEAFDHGSDSLAIHMWAIFLGNALRLNGMDTLLLFNLLMSVFFLAHWENYYTKQLILRELSNPTETQLLTILCLWVTGIVGQDYWLNTIYIPLLGNTKYQHIILLLITSGTVSTILDHVTTVKDHAIPKGYAFVPSFLFLSPVIAHVTLFYVWSVVDVKMAESPLFIVTAGLIFSYIAVRAIVQCVARESFVLLYRPLWIPVIGTAASIINKSSYFIEEDTLLAICLLASLLIFSKLAVTVIREFCTVLGIRAFTLPGVLSISHSFLPTTMSPKMSPLMTDIHTDIKI